MLNLRSFWANRSCRYGSLVVLSMLLLILVVPLILPLDPTTQNLQLILQPPSRAHLLGTDFYGRDLLSRVIYGGRMSLSVSLLASGLALLLGTAIGLLAGYCQGWIEHLTMRFVDLVMGFPRLFIILLLIGLMPNTQATTILILGCFSWMEIARLVRADTRAILTANYFRAAQALGLPHHRLVLKYVLPNLRGLLWTSANLLLATMLTVESSLSFLGLGVTEPNASWGTLLSQGRLDPFGAWWVALFAGAAIIITVIGFNLLGDGLNQIYGESKR